MSNCKAFAKTDDLHSTLLFWSYSSQHVRTLPTLGQLARGQKTLARPQLKQVFRMDSVIWGLVLLCWLYICGFPHKRAWAGIWNLSWNLLEKEARMLYNKQQNVNGHFCHCWQARLDQFAEYLTSLYQTYLNQLMKGLLETWSSVLKQVAVCVYRKLTL